MDLTFDPKGARITMADSLLVGSINLDSAEEVFAAVGEHLKDEVSRVPDGETGDRLGWIFSLAPRIKAVPDLESANKTYGDGHAVDMRFEVFRMKEGVKADEVEFGNLGYADDALASYEFFKSAVDNGTLKRGTRFLVSLPTAYMALLAYIDVEERDALYPAYRRALGNEIERMLAVIPKEELGIQWDIPAEVGMAEEVDPRTPWKLDDAAKELGEMAALVPDGVELGWHHCYGDPPDKETGHGKHWYEPPTADAMVRLTNAFLKHVERRSDWVHMPVPIQHTGPEFFAPLADLELPDETRLYLGLLHVEDGVDGANKRIESASRYVTGFGVATECGLGRIPRDEVIPTLDLHKQVKVPALSRS